jgi:hypothetical protein
MRPSGMHIDTQLSASLLGDQLDNRNQPRTSFPCGAWSHRPTDVAAHIIANTSPARPTTSTADNNSSRLAEEDCMFLIRQSPMSPASDGRSGC